MIIELSVRPKTLAAYIITLTLTICACHCRAQGSAPGAAGKHEVRAVWLTTYGGLDWPRTKARDAATAEKQRDELARTLDMLQAANINTVIFQARIRATVAYPSAMEPWDECLTGTAGQAPGYDPLAFAVAECHKRGMEIQAWVVAIPAGPWTSAGCRRLRKSHPKMVVKRGNYGFIDPESPSAAGYIASICEEIVRNYDVDGIHLDYIRYPETWRPAIGADRARRGITRIVERIYGAVKQIKPWVKLSCAPIGKYSDLPRYASNGWNALVKGCQDAQAWMKRGIMDQIYPMLYFRGNQFYPFAIDWNENSDGRTVVPGLGVYFLSKAEGDWPLCEITRQMGVSRTLGMGYAMFRNKFFCDDTKGLYTFAKDVFNANKALVPPMDWANSARPQAPARIDKLSADGYEAVEWSTVDTGCGGGTLYNLYASAAYPVDTDDPRNLVAQRLTANSVTLRGNDNMFYAVTSMNRYGQESPAVQMAAPPAPVSTGTYIENDGHTMRLPDKGYALDADYILIKSLSGVVVATRPYRGKTADVSRIAEGCYTVYSLNKKDVTHRLGFVMIKRRTP